MTSYIQQAFIVFVLFFSSLTFAQTREISGSISASGSVEGIHVINRTSYRYATSDIYGVFKIQAKLSDTLYFSSVQYESKTIYISLEMIEKKLVAVQLEDAVTALDEVTIGKILTGNLGSDVDNSDAKRPLDFYDFGLPGYTGPRKTLIENRLGEATAGSYIYWGIPPQANLWKLLNKITGRTKRLQQNYKIEKDKNILTHIKDVVGPELFKYKNLDDDLRAEFYFYCADDENFQMRCTDRSDVEILQFLEEKLINFKANISSEN